MRVLRRRPPLKKKIEDKVAACIALARRMSSPDEVLVYVRNAGTRDFFYYDVDKIKVVCSLKSALLSHRALCTKSGVSSQR